MSVERHFELSAIAVAGAVRVVAGNRVGGGRADPPLRP